MNKRNKEKARKRAWHYQAKKGIIRRTIYHYNWKDTEYKIDWENVLVYCEDL